MINLPSNIHLTLSALVGKCLSVSAPNQHQRPRRGGLLAGQWCCEVRQASETLVGLRRTKKHSTAGIPPPSLPLWLSMGVLTSPAAV